MEQPWLRFQCARRNLAGDSSLREGCGPWPKLSRRLHQSGKCAEGGQNLRPVSRTLKIRFVLNSFRQDCDAEIMTYSGSFLMWKRLGKSLKKFCSFSTLYFWEKFENVWRLTKKIWVLSDSNRKKIIEFKIIILAISLMIPPWSDPKRLMWLRRKFSIKISKLPTVAKQWVG